MVFSPTRAACCRCSAVDRSAARSGARAGVAGHRARRRGGDRRGDPRLAGAAAGRDRRAGLVGRARRAGRRGDPGHAWCRTAISTRRCSARRSRWSRGGRAGCRRPALRWLRSAPRWRGGAMRLRDLAAVAVWRDDLPSIATRCRGSASGAAHWRLGNVHAQAGRWDDAIAGSRPRPARSGELPRPRQPWRRCPYPALRRGRAALVRAVAASPAPVPFRPLFNLGVSAWRSAAAPTAVRRSAGRWRFAGLRAAAAEELARLRAVTDDPEIDFGSESQSAEQGPKLRRRREPRGDHRPGARHLIRHRSGH